METFEAVIDIGQIRYEYLAIVVTFCGMIKCNLLAGRRIAPLMPVAGYFAKYCSVFKELFNWKLLQ